MATTLLSSIQPIRAQPVTDADVERAITEGTEALLGALRDDWLIRVRDKNERVITLRGEVLSRSGNRIRFRKHDGTKLTIARNRIDSMIPKGAYSREVQGIHKGGHTALVTFALLSAGVRASHPKIESALQYLQEAELPGTYSRALRAGIWSLLAQHEGQRVANHKYRHLLRADSRWLIRAMDSEGWYTYHDRGNERPSSRRRGDHSCTQFGVLGTWACAEARSEIPRSYWNTVETHWLAQQARNGGWAYAPGGVGDRETMTTAGINSLYIVLDEKYAQSSGAYKRFDGILKTPGHQRDEAVVLDAIRRGLVRMADYGGRPQIESGGYRQFGLERLGRASGLKYIGGRDWYREGAAAAVARRWTGSSPDDPFWLIFLAHSRVPILFNKLAWGEEANWNYYTRDLHSICRYLYSRYERRVKWQIISLDVANQELRAVPFLYINGTAAFDPTPSELDKLRDYCDSGGTIIGHANRRSETFSGSFRSTISALFSGRGWKFETVPADHKIFALTGSTALDREPVPLEGLSDGNRIVVFLFPADVAGAWHRNMTASQEDLFRLIAGIATYVAPPYRPLPSALGS